jgi:hypothetical protein
MGALGDRDLVETRDESIEGMFLEHSREQPAQRTACGRTFPKALFPSKPGKRAGDDAMVISLSTEN